MGVIKKSRRKATPQPELDLLKATLKVVKVEENTEPKELKDKDGNTFTVDPHVKLDLLVVDDDEYGDADGEVFFDRFKLSEEDGEWTVREGTKLGNLVAVLYGEDWFEDDDSVFDAKDLEGFEFVATVKPRKNPNTGRVYGSMVDWESLRAVKGAKVS